MLTLILQVNEKFNKLERVYRDCIKRTRDKTRIIQYTARCTRRLMHCDQTRKYGISESIIQGYGFRDVILLASSPGLSLRARAIITSGDL